MCKPMMGIGFQSVRTDDAFGAIQAWRGRCGVVAAIVRQSLLSMPSRPCIETLLLRSANLSATILFRKCSAGPRSPRISDNPRISA
jgi:hypothetical protein